MKLSDGYAVFQHTRTCYRSSASLHGAAIRSSRRLALILLGATLILTTFSVPLSNAAESATPSSRPIEKEKCVWKPLFDGKTLKDWKVTNFGGEGEVVVKEGVIDMGMGSPLTGITYMEKFPNCDYEVRVEAMRINGIDFFSTVTFPVKDSFCSLVVGGWAGPVVGISCIDGFDASENETTTYHKFELKQWYTIRVRVRDQHIGAWIDDKQVVDLDTTGHELSTRAEVSLSEPFGIASFQTRAGIRKIKLRQLPPRTKNR